MSRYFGQIVQVGYVVHDLRKAMEHWVDLGVGPWFYDEDARVTNFRFRGTPQPDLHLTAGVAYAGDLQLEVIQQLNDVPSAFKEFLDSGREGAQHVAYWPADFDEAVTHAKRLGYSLLQEGEVGGPDGRFVYLDSEIHSGTVIELSDIHGHKGMGYQLARLLSQSWDGKNPIRKAGIATRIAQNALWRMQPHGKPART